MNGPARREPPRSRGDHHRRLQGHRARQRPACWRPAAMRWSSTTCTTSAPAETIARPGARGQRHRGSRSEPTSRTRWTSPQALRGNHRGVRGDRRCHPYRPAVRSVLPPWQNVDLNEFDALCRSTTRATFLVNRQAARHPFATPVPSSTSSSSAGRSSPKPGHGALAAAKASTDTLTRVLALELHARGHHGQRPSRSTWTSRAQPTWSRRQLRTYSPPMATA